MDFAHCVQLYAAAVICKQAKIERNHKDTCLFSKKSYLVLLLASSHAA